MCGESTYKKAFLFLGYSEGCLRIEDVVYRKRYGQDSNPEEIKAKLNKMKKSELIDLLIGFVDNAKEGQ